MYVLSKIRLTYYIGITNLWRPKTVIRTKTKGIDLSHRIHGPSPTPGGIPIIVLHGCLASKRNWESICKKITAYTNKTVIAVDARNHGDSPHTETHNYFDLAADVSKLMSKFSIKTGIIIGHSMGGRTGMILALTEPSKVASLIVVDISPISTSSTLKDFFPKVIDVMATMNFKGLDLNKAKNAAKNKIVEKQLFQNEEDMQFILNNIGKLPDKSIGWKFNLDVLKKNFNVVASFPSVPGKNYNGPTLFLGGKLSYCIPPDDIFGIQRLFPKASVVYIDGVGHNLHDEDPNTFLNTIVQFLSYNALLQTQA